LTEQELKAQLQAIAQDDYRLPAGLDHFELALEMLRQIGSLDPELRDDLIYRTLLKWTVNGLFSHEQLSALLAIALDNDHLLHRLGEQNTDSVFTRAFSSLTVVLPLYAHRRDPFLSSAQVQATLAKVLLYLSQEKDLRGYVEGKGWAHATAHAADVLDELAQCDEVDRLGLVEILAAIRARMSVPDSVFIHEEDERMAYAALSLIQRGTLSDAEIKAWISSFAPIEKTGDVARDRHRLVNVKNFLRSLYFQSWHRHLVEFIQLPVSETLYAISNFK
jgi:hypothetical protein